MQLPALPIALQALNVSGCESMQHLPDNWGDLLSLVWLECLGCPAFADASLTAAVYCNQLVDWERHKQPSAFAEMLSTL